jgi:septum formation topological specificity factor MinE
MSADKSVHDIPDEVIESLARTILPSIRKYFESEEGQREFDEWKKKNEQTVAKAAKPE